MQSEWFRGSRRVSTQARVMRSPGFEQEERHYTAIRKKEVQSYNLYQPADGRNCLLVIQGVSLLGVGEEQRLSRALRAMTQLAERCGQKNNGQLGEVKSRQRKETPMREGTTIRQRVTIKHRVGGRTTQLSPNAVLLYNSGTIVVWSRRYEELRV